MIVYISGPITGLYLGNHAAFHDMHMKLIDMGHSVVNPHYVCRNLDPKKATHQDYMRACVQSMLACNAIVMLPGWENSKGAKVEKIVAESIGLEFIEVQE